MNQKSQLVVCATGAISIATSVYFLSTGERHSGVFMGLWAPLFFVFGALFAALGANKPAPVPARVAAPHPLAQH